MNIGLRIKELCIEKDGNMTTMEKALGFSHGYIHALTVKGTTPSATRLQKIADYLGVTVDVLLGKTPSEPQPSTGVLIPVLGRVAAGIPISAIENIIGYEEITQQMAKSGEFFALKIKGDSMAPYIMEGDIVIVREQPDAENGDVIIALVNGNDACCKKLQKSEGSVKLISLNPAYEPMVFTHSEIDTIPVQVIGRVMEIRRAL